MGATAGRKALVKVTGSPVALTNEATTANGGRTVYTITNSAKRILDPTAAVVVQTSPDGVSWSTASAYSLNRLQGTVTFGSAQAVGTQIRIQSGSYLPVATAAAAKGFTFSISATNPDTTAFGDTFQQRIQGMKSVSGSLSQWRTSDVTLRDALLNATRVVLEFWIDSATSYDARIWAILNKQQVQAAVEGIVEESVDFESTPDADGNVVG